MILDTGASSVVLTQEAAKAAGLPLEVLSYSVHGRHRQRPHPRGAGDAADRSASAASWSATVPALIAQPGQLRQSLLGMSFLNRLEGWEVRGDRLMLRAIRDDASPHQADAETAATPPAETARTRSRACRFDSACASLAP